MNLLQEQTTTFLTQELGRAPTSAELAQAIISPWALANVHNEANVTSSTLAITSADNIQTAIDAINTNGGGTVLLNPGTYVLTSDINIPSGVTIQGASRDNCVIDCNSSYKVNMVGTNTYTTGTVSVNNNSLTVTGSGTTWVASMIGQYIFLGGGWYLIANVVDTHTITLDSDYFGSNISGDACVIANPVFLSTVTKITITNSTGTGLNMQYASEPQLRDIVVYGCGTGIYTNYVYAPYVNVTSYINGVNGDFNNTSAFEITFSAFPQSTSGDGVKLTNCTSATFFDSDASNNFANGITLTSCSNIAFVSLSVNSNGAKGVELVSGNQYLEFNDMEIAENVSDGLKITGTSQSLVVNAEAFHDNGGYGVNVASANGTNTIIAMNTFATNSSGAVHDLGTGTLIRSNIGVVDN